MTLDDRLHGIPILISEYVPRDFIASLRELPGESILQTTFPFTTQETNPMSTPRLIPTKRADVEPGDIFRYSRNPPSGNPTRFRAVKQPQGADRFYSQALDKDGYPKPSLSHQFDGDTTVYVETEERRSGTDRRQSDRPRTENVFGFDLRPGDNIYSFGAVRPVLTSITGDIYRPDLSNNLVPISPAGAYARVLPERRSGEERRSGD